MWRDILLIYSALDSEDTWMETEDAWSFFIKSVELRGRRFFSQGCL